MIMPRSMDGDEGDGRQKTQGDYRLTTDQLANQLAIAFDSSAEEFRSFAEAINCLSDDNPRRTQLGELIVSWADLFRAGDVEGYCQAESRVREALRKLLQ